jgi:hypothetical protein
MLSLEQVDQHSYKIMVDNSSRNIAFSAYMQMYRSGWDLPPEIKALPWIQKVINSDPYDATQTGVRIIATIPASISFQPLAPGAENRKRSGVIEKVCKWQMKSANRRRSRTVEYEIAKMALLYDMCAVKTVDLQYEIQEKERMSASAEREKAALAKGRFMIVPYDARDVYAVWSNLGLESVLVAQHKHAGEIIAEFGDKARQFPELIELAKQTHDTDWITYYDYTDLETRSIWVNEGRTWRAPEPGTSGMQWVIDHGSNPLTFINWSVKGGSELETDPVHKFQPLLYPIYATGAWDIKNIVQTLGVSEVIAHTGSPRFVEEGPNPQQSEIDYFTPERIAKLATGNTLKALAPPGVDQALANVEAMLSAQLDKATVSSILQGGALPAGIAFATLNLVTQTAIGVLTPAKDLAQKTLADVYTQMLLWVDFTNQPLYGFDTSDKSTGTELKVEPQHVSPDSIYIDVELHPDAPTDKAQKVNTAGIMVEKLGFSQESALAEVGVEDPSEEIVKQMQERLIQHELDMQLSREMIEQENELALDLMEEQMMMEMAAAQAQKEGEGGEGEAPPTVGGGEEGFEQEPGATGPGGSPRGEGFGPDGMPSAMFAPEDNAAGAGGVGAQGGESIGEAIQ